MPVEWIPLVSLLLNMAVRVGASAGAALHYRRKCQLLQTRVQIISTHLRALEKAQWTPDPLAAKDTLECLGEVLGRAELLVVSCLRKKKAFDFLKAFKNKGEFAFVNEQISHIMEAFHLANHTLLLLVCHDRDDRIFVAVLDTLIEDGACRRLPQAKKDELEKLMSELSCSENMPPEKRSRLELIRRELRAGSHRRQCWDAGSASSGNSGRDQNDPALKRVAGLAGEIVEEAKAARSHNKEEVQRVAQLAQKVMYLLPHLQPPMLARHEIQRTITKLLDDLHGALQTITQHNRPLHCGPSALVPSSYWKQQAKRIAELGNDIEEGYQTLTLKVLQHITANV